MIRNLFLFCAGLAVGICFAVATDGNNVYIPSYRIMITAAHTSPAEGYSVIYSDEETDYAIHMLDDYVATQLTVGAAVDLAGTTGKIIATSNSEFFIEVKDVSKIVPGVSGTRVAYKEMPVGFISGWAGDGTLRCIYY